MKSYYFEEGIISEKMGCGAECTSSIIRNLNEADYIIKKAFKEINSHDKLSKVSFVSCSDKIGEIQCMYDNYIQSRDLYCEYGNEVDKKFTKEQEKVCDSLGDLNINKITVGDNLGVYDYQRPDSVKTLNLSVLLAYGDIDKALREDYEKQVKNIEYLRELAKLDDSQWPPEYTAEQVKAIKDYVKYLDDNEIKFDTYEKERQKFLESDDLNFITKGEERLSLILDFIPGVGLIKGGYETIVGVDPITKRKLSGVERSISGFACLLDAKGLYKIGKTAFKVSVKDGAKFGSKYLAKEFAKDTIGGYGFYAATQAADKAGIGPKGQLAIIGGLLAYGNRKNITGAVSKADAKLKGVNKGSFLDEMRLTNKAEYKRLMANLSDVTKDKKVYMSCFGAGTFEQIYKSNKNLREVTKILDNCKFTDFEKAEIHKLLSSGDKAEISRFSKVCASSAGDSKKIKEYLEGYSWKDVDSLIDGVEGVSNPELNRIDYLRNKYGKLTSEQVNNRINLRGAVNDEIDRLYKSGLTKNEIGPAVAGVLDTKTGKYYFGINNIEGDVPEVLHPLIKERIDNMPLETYNSYKKWTLGAGSHAEVYALNEAMLANPNAKLEDFMVYVVRSGKKLKPRGLPMPRCPHCEYITDGASYFPEVLKYGK